MGLEADKSSRCTGSRPFFFSVPWNCNRGSSGSTFSKKHVFFKVLNGNFLITINDFFGGLISCVSLWLVRWFFNFCNSKIDDVFVRFFFSVTVQYFPYSRYMNYCLCISNYWLCRLKSFVSWLYLIIARHGAEAGPNPRNYQSWTESWRHKRREWCSLYCGLSRYPQQLTTL